MTHLTTVRNALTSALGAARTAWRGIAPESRDFLVTAALMAVGLAVPLSMAGYLALHAGDPLNRVVGVLMLAGLGWFAVRGLAQMNRRRKRRRRDRRWNG